MKEDKLKALAAELAKEIKTERDLSAFSGDLMKLVVETALGAEMAEHLGYDKYEATGRGSGNSRNGTTRKKVRGSHGVVEIETPRDRNGTFEPQIIGKRQTRLTQFDDQILALYAKGMSTRDIVAAFRDMYDADVSASLVSRVTDAVLDEVEAWQSRPLDPLYPILYLDCLVMKVRQGRRVIRKSVYLALAVNIDGYKELLGLWIAETEGAHFWLDVLTELYDRGVADILIACVDGLTGFPDAIEAVYPQTKVQLCIVHMMRNSLRFVPWKERKRVAADLKSIYRSTTLDQAEQALDDFAQKWDEKYPSIARMWHRHWANLIPLFDYPQEIRKVMYTTNAIESLNSVVRKAVKNRKIFPSDQAVFKTVYLATQAASARWTRPVHRWTQALNRFMLEFGERVKID